MQWLDTFMENHTVEPINGQEFIDGMHDLGAQQNWAELDRILLLPTEESSTSTFLFFLRASFPFRENLSNWTTLRDLAKTVLDSRGYVSELLGLV